MALSTLGPGATNFTTAAAYAHLGGFPMLLISGQKPILKSKQGAFQIVNIVDLFKPITKYTKQVGTRVAGSPARSSSRGEQGQAHCSTVGWPEKGVFSTLVRKLRCYLLAMTAWVW